jgi:glucosamine kinase
MQGWSPPSGLGPLLASVTGVATVDATLGHFYNDPAPNPKIAALAPAVLRLAAAGDAAAAALAIDSASGLLDLAVSVAAKVFPGAPAKSLRAGLSGSILTHPVIAQALAARSPFNLKLVDEPAIEGVRRLLIRKIEGGAACP